MASRRECGECALRRAAPLMERRLMQPEEPACEAPLWPPLWPPLCWPPLWAGRERAILNV